MKTLRRYRHFRNLAGSTVVKPRATLWLRRLSEACTPGSECCSPREGRSVQECFCRAASRSQTSQSGPEVCQQESGCAHLQSIQGVGSDSVPVRINNAGWSEKSQTQNSRVWFPDSHRWARQLSGDEGVAGGHGKAHRLGGALEVSVPCSGWWLLGCVSMWTFIKLHIEDLCAVLYVTLCLSLQNTHSVWGGGKENLILQASSCIDFHHS